MVVFIQNYLKTSDSKIEINQLYIINQYFSTDNDSVSFKFKQEITNQAGNGGTHDGTIKISK